MVVFGMMIIPICLCAKFFKPLFRFKPMFHSQVGAKSFIIPNDKDIYCVPCFEDKVLFMAMAILIADKGCDKMHKVSRSFNNGGSNFQRRALAQVTLLFSF